MTPFLLLIQLVLGATLMWCSFCRLVKTDHDTHREVRWAFIFELMAGGLVFGAPFMPTLMAEADWEPWTTPYWVWIVLLASFSFVQLTTAVHWASGKVPTLFQRRRADDTPRFFTGWPMAAITSFLIAVFLVGPSMAIAQAIGRAQEKEPIVTPIFHMEQGAIVGCAAAEGCIIFTKKALALELARYADHACPMLKGPRT